MRVSQATHPEFIFFGREGWNMENDPTRKYRSWKLLSWLVVLVFLCAGVSWLFSVPSVGKGGVLLAVGATLMPLFWEKIDVAGRMSWIAMLFILASVEYRAINQDQQETAKKQQETLKQIGDGFKAVLTTQQTSFSNLISQSQTNFHSLIDDERTNFKGMMTNNLQSQRQQNANFAALLGQEKELLNNQKELYEFASDKLVPASEPTPPNSCRSQLPGDVFVFLGTRGNATVTNQFPNTILQVKDHDVVSIDRGEGDSLVLSVDMRDASGKMIANLSKNGFIVSKNYELYLLRPDKSTVIIWDGYEKEILKARFLNPNAFALQGTVQYLDRIVPLEFGMLTNSCMGHSRKAEISIK